MSVKRSRRGSVKAAAKKLAAMPDSAIDFSDIPPLGEDFWKNAKLFLPQRKAAVGLRIDADVLDWFKRQGPGYQSRMNAVLKAYKATHERRGRQK